MGRGFAEYSFLRPGMIPGQFILTRDLERLINVRSWQRIGNGVFFGNAVILRRHYLLILSRMFYKMQFLLSEVVVGVMNRDLGGVIFGEHEKVDRGQGFQL